MIINIHTYRYYVLYVNMLMGNVNFECLWKQNRQNEEQLKI